MAERRPPRPPAGDTATELRALLAEWCGPGVEIADRATWESLGLDSLDEVQIQFDVEDRFGLPEDVIGEGGLPGTFGELAALVDRHRGGAGVAGHG